MNVKLGILREGKVPPDHRVALLPGQCLELMKKYPGLSIVVQPSDIRCIKNQEYVDAGIPLAEDLQDCDILVGIKEVPYHQLIPEKTYFFFSHTIKKQPYNKILLQTALERKIRLIDYECLRDREGNRIVAFGKFAGVVGTYNGILLYGKKNNLFQLKRAYECFDIAEMKQELKKVKLGNIKLVLTGSGRVAKGAVEILDYLKIKKVSVEAFLSKEFSYPIYVQLASKDYHVKRDGGSWDREEFFKHPERYSSTFQRFLDKCDILIAGAYWNPAAPVLFDNDDIKKSDFRVQVIADITCDIGGSIPSTIKPTTILEPAYDYNPYTKSIEALFSGKNVTVMAIDNLPGEVPRDASSDFGIQLMNNAFPYLFGEDKDKIIERATIVNKGQLMPEFEYLSDYAGL